jgi:hypothetical protein
MIAGYFWAGDNASYNGLLIAPIDGNSYLAKMMEGQRGEWKFTLPYTSEKGEGAYIFLYYLFLGYVCSWLHLPTILVFHIARIIGALCLASAISLWIRRTIQDQKIQIFTMILILFGSGMGWLLLPLKIIPTDLWVSEAYPFLSSLANPHFPLGIALILWIIYLYTLPETWARITYLFDLTLLLSLVMPFGVVIVCMIVLFIEVANGIKKQKVQIIKLVITTIGGGAYLLYQYFAILSDPVLAQWNSQNLTAAPPVWDVIISFSPALLLAVYGIGKYRKGQEFISQYLPFIIWIIGGAILLYLPFNLQRRFLVGYYVPVGFMAGIFLDKFRKSNSDKLRKLPEFVLALSLITNIIFLTGILETLKRNDPMYYQSNDEIATLQWLDENAPNQSVVLASPQFANLIPAKINMRVVYGHPYETVDAENQINKIESYYNGEMLVIDIKQWFKDENVSYVICGPREKMLGNDLNAIYLSLVKQQGDIQIYMVTNE